jgi:secreted trypsin-like serine protease
LILKQHVLLLFFLIYTEDTCGKNGILGATFVVNNNPIGHWPWMASYGFIDEKKKWQHQCGATLISDHHFLTASHCVKEGANKG